MALVLLGVGWQWRENVPSMSEHDSSRVEGRLHFQFVDDPNCTTPACKRVGELGSRSKGGGWRQRRRFACFCVCLRAFSEQGNKIVPVSRPIRQWGWIKHWYRWDVTISYPVRIVTVSCMTSILATRDVKRPRWCGPWSRGESGSLHRDLGLQD